MVKSLLGNAQQRPEAWRRTSEARCSREVRGIAAECPERCAKDLNGHGSVRSECYLPFRLNRVVHAIAASMRCDETETLD